MKTQGATAILFTNICNWESTKNQTVLVLFHVPERYPRCIKSLKTEMSFFHLGSGSKVFHCKDATGEGRHSI